MSIWFMYDNHKFKQLSDDPQTAMKEALAEFDYGGEIAVHGSIGLRGEHGDGLIIHASGNRAKFEKDLRQWVDNFKMPEETYEVNITKNGQNIFSRKCKSIGVSQTRDVVPQYKMGLDVPQNLKVVRGSERTTIVLQ